MRDIRNLLVELTNGEKDFLHYVLDELIKTKELKLIVNREEVVSLGYSEKTIRDLIKLLSVAEVIRHRSTGRKQEFISVTGKADFYKLIKMLGVR